MWAVERKKNSIFFVIIIIMLFFMVRNPATFVVVEKTASVLLYPCLRLQHAVSSWVHHARQARRNMRELKDALCQARTANKELLAQNIALHATLWYSNHTQELHSFARRYATDYMTVAHVIGKSFDPYHHTLLVDKGSAHGVITDMVAVYKNCLIGRVIEVYPYSCKVLAVTDPSCKIPVYCFHANVQGIYEGTGKMDAGKVLYVSHLERLQCPDMVISSGEGVIFPQGFALGIVQNYQIVDLQYSIDVKPLVNVQELEYCYLIKKGSYA